MTTPDAPDPRKVAEAALDVFVYAPMGLALEAKELLPKLAERGRNQVVMARLGARFAMQRAEAEVDRLLERLQPSETAPVTEPEAERAAAPVTEPAPEPATAAAPVRSRTAKPRAKAAPKPKPRASATLAIPGYDTLSASQVVPRLDALRANELEAIRRHEVSNRGRRTILSRIAQLQG
jgi:hypothetical protein